MGQSTDQLVVFVPTTSNAVSKIEVYASTSNTRKAYYNSTTTSSTIISGQSTTASALATSSTSYTPWGSTFNKGTYYSFGGQTGGSGNVYIHKVVVTFQDAEPRTFESGQKIYFKDASGNISGLSCLWKVSGGNVYACFYDDEATPNSAWSTYGDLVSGSWNAANAIYEITVPQLDSEDHTWTSVVFTRGTAATWGDGYYGQQTSNQSPDVGRNMFTISTAAAVDSKYNGSWGKYAKNPALVGDFNNWDPDESVFGDYSGNVGTAYFTLSEASKTYKFKILQGETWYSYDNSKAGWTLTATTTTEQQLYENNDESRITSTDVGEYIMKYDKSTHKFKAVYYPKERLAKNTYIYFDARNQTNWNSANFDARFGWQYYDSGTEQSWTIKAKGTALENWVYYAQVPDNDYIGRIQMKRLNPADNNTVWCTAEVVLSGSKSSIAQNCIKEETGKEDYCNSWTPQWTTYCPPISSATLSDNSTAKVSWQTGTGTSGAPYLVVASGTIKVSASATKAVEDDNMTINYDFKVSDNGGSASSAQSGTGTTYDKGSLTTGHTYEISLDAWNNYNNTNGTKNTSATHIWYKAVTLRNVVHTLSHVTCTGGRAAGENQAADDEPYSATFTAGTGYNLPSTITVKFGETTKTSSTDYTWNSSTGVLSIPASKIDGNVTITVTGEAKTTAITFDPNTANHGTSGDGGATATYDGTTLSSITNTTAASGYMLVGYYTTATDSPTEGVKIINADGTLVKNTTYTTNDDTPKWKSELAELTLYARYEVLSYTVSFAVSPAGYGSVDVSEITGISHGAEVSIADNVLTLKETDVTATATSAGADYTYAFDGWSVDDGDAITSTQTITANFTRTANQYSVSHSLTNATASSGSTGSNAATYGTDYTAIFAASSGYSLPSDVTVTIGGASATKGTEYTWNSSTGALTVGGEYILGNIAIEVTALRLYTLTYDDNGKTGGGSAPTDANKYEEDDEVTILANPNTMTKTNCVFMGWNTESDGTGTTYIAGETMTMPGANTTLYALWGVSLTWNVQVNVEETTVTTTSTASSYTTQIANPGNLALNDLTVTSNKKETATNKIQTTKSKNGYISATFAVQSGYQFRPTHMVLKTTAITEDKTIEVNVGSESQTWDQPKSGSSPDEHIYKFTDATAITGTGTMKIYAYGGKDGTKGYRLGTPITIYGIAEAAPVTGHDVNIAGDIENGTVSADKASAEEDETVTLTVTPDTGYKLETLSVTGDTSGDITVSNNKFTMPDEDVTVDATFTAIDYTITHSAASNGTYTIKVGDASAVSTNTTATYGQTVTLAATPSSGYVLSGWNVTGATVGNNHIESTTFTMPAGNVTIAPVFKATPNVYYYKDATHFTAPSTWKNPEGNAPSNTTDETLSLTDPWTVISNGTITGVTSVVVNAGKWDNKSGKTEKWVTAYIKINTGGDKDNDNITFTIAEGYTATLKMKVGAWSGSPSVTLKPLEDSSLGDAISYSGTLGGYAPTENAFNELTWSSLTEGVYVLNVSGKNCYVSEIDIQTTPNQHDITYTAPSNGTYTIQAGDASAVSTDVENVDYATTVTLAATPNMGYSLSSWTVTGDTSEEEVTVTSNQFSMPDEDVTVAASFSANPYTITLNLNGGDAGSTSVTATYNSSSLSISTLATKTDYKLYGYSTVADGGTLVIDADGDLIASVTNWTDGSRNWIMAHDTTLYARWLAPPTVYTVSGAEKYCTVVTITLSGSQVNASYQLYKDAVATGDPKDGTGSALTWDVSDEGTYTVKTVENAYFIEGEMSGSVSVSHYTSEKITTQPTSPVEAEVNKAVEIGLEAEGENNVQYQWQSCDKSDGSGTNTDITSGPAYAGYTTNTLTFTPASAGTYYFRCIVSDDCENRDTSDVVTVTAYNRYPVVHSLENVTKTSGATSVLGNHAYEAVYAGTTGYAPPSSDSVTVKFGTTIKTLDTDYTWTRTTGTLSILADRINDSVTVIIKGRPKNYTITLDNQDADDGKGGTASFEATYGSGFWGIADTPEKTGYVFGGYYTATGGSGVKILNESGQLRANATGYTDAIGNWIYDGGTTLYAYWMKSTCAITLDANGGDANGSATATNGSNKLTSITRPTRSHYHVDGYYKESGLTNLIASANGNLQAYTDYTDADGKWIAPTDTTLYAKWALDEYTITYYDADTTTIDTLSPTSYTYESEDIVLPIPTKECYTFDGWIKYGYNYKKNKIEHHSSGNYGFVATWIRKSHTLTWNFDGGSTSATEGDNYTAGGTVNCGASLTYPGNGTMSKSGYTFAGWSSSATEMPDDDLTITALWTAQTYAVTLDPDNGNSTSAVTATYGASMPSKLSDGETDVAVPTFSGYIFGGYYDDHAGAGTQYYDGSVASAHTWDKASTATLYAKWTQTVTLNMQGVVTNLTPTATYNATALSGYSLTDSLCGLQGYYTAPTEGTKVLNADGTFAASSVTDYITGGKWTKAGSTTLYAHWITVTTPMTINKSNAAAYSHEMTWYGDGDLYFDYGPSSAWNLERWAEWQVNVVPCEYTISEVSYCINGHTWLLELISADTVTTSYTTTDVHYGIGDQDYAQAVKWDLRNIPAGQYTLRVKNATKWGQPKLKSITLSSTAYTVTYNAHGGSCETASETQSYGCAALTLPVATRDGYTFDGWYDGTTKAGDAGDTYTPTANVTLKAVWIVTAPATLDKGNVAFYGGNVAIIGDTISYKDSTAWAEWKVNLTPYEYTMIVDGFYHWGHQWKLYLTNESDTLSTRTLSSTYDTGSYTETATWALSEDIDKAGIYKVRLMSIKKGGDPKLLSVAMMLRAVFTGATDDQWNKTTNWSIGSLPTIEHDVVIQKPAEVDVTNAVAKSIVIDQSSSNMGHLTIPAGKALVVATTIRKTSDGSTLEATETGDLTIGSTAEAGNGALVIGGEDGTNQATVRFYTKAGKNAKNEWVNQYIGTPFNDETYIKNNYYGTQMYAFNASSGEWIKPRMADDADMTPFLGYNLLSTQSAGINLEMTGTLNESTEVTKTLTNDKDEAKENILANSWVAPIQIGAFKDDDFVNVSKTIYIFNAGSPEDYETNSGAIENAANDRIAAGQYTSIPINLAEFYDNYHTIPSMQAFSVLTTASASTATLKLNYERLVYDPAVKGITIEKNHMRRREQAAAAAPDIVKLFVSGESGYRDEVWMVVRNDFSDGFDDGWEAQKLFGNDEAPQLYAQSEVGPMSVDAVSDVEGTVLGFKAGTKDDEYTFRFQYDEPETLYLLDTQTGTYTDVDNDHSYTFLTDDIGSHNRFVLTRYRSPQITTGMEPTSDLQGSEKAVKLMDDNKLFILFRGVLYDATGKRVEERRAQQ